MPTGLLDGSLSSFGEYDECLNIDNGDENDLRVEGQYCLVKVVIPYPNVCSYKAGQPISTALFSGSAANFLHLLPSLEKIIEGLNWVNGSTYRLGMCLPSTCTPEALTSAFNQGKDCLQSG